MHTELEMEIHYLGAMPRTLSGKHRFVIGMASYKTHDRKFPRVV
jgi:hypothetical protein